MDTQVEQYELSHPGEDAVELTAVLSALAEPVRLTIVRTAPAIVAGAVVSCTITNTPVVGTITFSKALASSGRFAPNDQFIVGISAGGVAQTVPGTTQTNGAGSTVSTGTGTTTNTSNVPCSLSYSLNTYDTSSGVTHVFLTGSGIQSGPSFGH